MNLLDAAIDLLRTSKSPLTAAALAALAVEKKLVPRAGAAAAKKLDEQLGEEAEADGARVERAGDGFVAVKAKAAKGKAKTEEPKAKAAAKGKDKPAPKAAAKPAAKAAAKPAPKGKDKPAPKGKGKAEAKPKAAPEVIAEALEPFAPAPEPGPAVIDVGRDPLEDEDEDELADRIHHTAEVLEAEEHGEVEPPVALSPEEQELVTLYGDELGGGQIATAEFRDSRTADEDRPMVPEINAREERNKRWEDRRRKRRERRDERTPQRDPRRPGGPGPTPAAGAERPAGEVRAEGGRPEGGRPEGGRHEGGRPDGGGRPGGGDRGRFDGGRPGGPAREGRPPHVRQEVLPLAAAAAPAAPAPVPGSNGHHEHVVHRVGNSLGDAAWAVFTSLRPNPQPMPVKQLAAMMRKRGMIEVDPEQAWPHLKAALIGDERSYRQLGLRPRIVYRGRDLFGVGPIAHSTTSAAETSLAQALSQLAVATHTVLKARIGRADGTGFERLVHAYLVSTGYQDIEWVKRVGGISYATAQPPDGGSPILVSARSGDSPVDRRGVGELRVGVEAKQLLAGLLLSTRELSEDAERELVRPGRSIMVLCGDAFVGALIGAGIGVVTAAAPLRYVDDQLLDELIDG